MNSQFNKIFKGPGIDQIFPMEDFIPLVSPTPNVIPIRKEIDVTKVIIGLTVAAIVVYGLYIVSNEISERKNVVNK